MPKNKSRFRSLSTPGLSRQLSEHLDQARDLASRKRYAEALDLLESLLQRSPNRDEILTALVNVSLDAGDQARYLQYIDRLSKLRPDDPDIALGLAGSYLQNAYPVMAARAFRRFLSRWPDHPRAAEVRSTLTDLQQHLAGLLAEVGLPANEDTAALHEEMQIRLNRGDYAGARRIGEDLLRAYPNFPPALNNISLAYMAEGDHAQAVSAAQRALAIAPDNFHALGNLVQFMCLAGRLDEAKHYADRLRATSQDTYDAWLKKLEAFSLLGDDDAVLETFAAASRSDSFQEPVRHNPMVFHLAAAATCRKGDEKAARSLWNKALQISPAFTLARDNLDDLRNPPGKRHGAWAFDMRHWISARLANDINAILSPATNRKDSEKALSQAVQKLVQKHPELTAILHILLERGDPAGCKFALMLASLIKTPETLAALQAFMLGQRGSDEMRVEASRILSEADAAPVGPVRLWIKGAWQDVLTMGFQISGDAPPSIAHSDKVRQLGDEAILAIQNEQWDRAEELLEQALQIEPDSPDLLNNLASVYNTTDRYEEARKVMFDLHQRFPDYFFGITNVAQILAREGKPEEAEKMIQPLLARKRLHTSEFASLCQAQIEVWLAKGRPDAARSWLQMWEQANSEHPAIEFNRRRLRKPNIWQKITGR